MSTSEFKIQTDFIYWQLGTYYIDVTPHHRITVRINKEVTGDAELFFHDKWNNSRNIEFKDNMKFFNI